LSLVTPWIARVLGRWPGWGFGGLQSIGVISDWAYTARYGRFPVLGHRPRETDLATLALPVLSIRVQGDVLTPPHTFDRMATFLPAVSLTVSEYRQDQATVDLNHINWARDGEAAAQQIAEWFHATPRPSWTNTADLPGITP
jgi:predicted alpha/beta hydrolase